MTTGYSYHTQRSHTFWVFCAF